MSSNDYLAISVSKSFLDDADCRNCSTIPNRNMTMMKSYSSNNYASYVNDIPTLLFDLHKDYKNNKLERLEPSQCMNRYATSIQSDRRHLLLVAGDENFPTPAENKYMKGSHVYWANPFYASDAESANDASDAYSWICSGLDTAGEGVCSSKIDEVRTNANAWRVGPYCLNMSSPYMPCVDSINLPVEYCL